MSWFSHGFYNPQGSFPNTADYLFDMDTCKIVIDVLTLYCMYHVHVLWNYDLIPLLFSVIRLVDPTFFVITSITTSDEAINMFQVVNIPSEAPHKSAYMPLDSAPVFIADTHPNYAPAWVDSFSCQAGIGLEWPGYSDPVQMSGAYTASSLS